ncbi:MAG: CHAD domain-containing protein [Ferruginibacter sp.]
MKKKIQDSIVAYGKLLEKHGKSISPGFDVEKIHEFRTTAKKLKALLHWQKVEKDILPGAFVKTYHISGDLRNAQLVLVSFTATKQPLPGFILWLATYIGKREHAFKKSDAKKSVTKLRNQLSKVGFNKSGVKSAGTFFNTTIVKLQAIMMADNPSDEEFHDARKMIKDLQYVKQWCEDHLEKIYLNSKIELEQLKHLSGLAGDYNDIVVSLSLFDAYLEEEKNSKLRKSALLAKTKMEQRKASLRNQLSQSLNDFGKQVGLPAAIPRKV